MDVRLNRLPNCGSAAEPQSKGVVPCDHGLQRLLEGSLIDRRINRYDLPSIVHWFIRVQCLIDPNRQLCGSKRQFKAVRSAGIGTLGGGGQQLEIHSRELHLCYSDDVLEFSSSIPTRTRDLGVRLSKNSVRMSLKYGYCRSNV